MGLQKVRYDLVTEQQQTVDESFLMCFTILMSQMLYKRDLKKSFTLTLGPSEWWQYQDGFNNADSNDLYSTFAVGEGQG